MKKRQRPLLRNSKDGFALVINEVPAWSLAAEKVLDATLHRVCCRLPFYRLTRVFHAPLHALPWGDEVEVYALTHDEAYYVALAMDLDTEHHWAMMVSIDAEEAEEAGNEELAHLYYRLLLERGFDKMGERIEEGEYA